MTGATSPDTDGNNSVSFDATGMCCLCEFDVTVNILRTEIRETAQHSTTPCQQSLHSVCVSVRNVLRSVNLLLSSLVIVLACSAQYFL